jgi:Rieske [2Fe-2S] domain
MLKYLVPKTTEVETVVRGRYYSVPCVQVPESILTLIGGFRSGDWIPIIGLLHSDPEIGVDYSHYHYDRRFCKYRIPAQSVLAFGVPGKKLLWPNDKTVVRSMWRKCYWPYNYAIQEFARSHIIQKLEDIHKKCRLQPNNLCPHRNIPLNGISIDQNGHIVCPAHGLKWHKASGELVRH